MNQFKIPSTIMEVLREATACASLAKQYDGVWFPSPRSLVYAEKERKLRKFATTALAQACPDVVTGEWQVDMVTGIVRRVLPPPKPKKPKVVAKKPMFAALESAHFPSGGSGLAGASPNIPPK